MVQKRPTEHPGRGESESRPTGQPVRQPQQDRSMATKERIIDAGFRLFSEKGYHKTNSKEIARMAGSGIGTFYDYFSDKKSLFLEILCRHRDGFLQSLQVPVFDNKITKLQLKRIVGEFIQYVFAFHENAPEFHKEAVLLRHSDSDIEGIMNEWDEALRKIIYNLLDAMHAQVRLKDTEAAAYIILRTIEDNIHFIHLSSVSIDKDRLQNELVDLIYIYIFGK